MHLSAAISRLKFKFESYRSCGECQRKENNAKAKVESFSLYLSHFPSLHTDCCFIYGHIHHSVKSEIFFHAFYNYFYSSSSLPTYHKKYNNHDVENVYVHSEISVEWMHAMWAPKSLRMWIIVWWEIKSTFYCKNWHWRVIKEENNFLHHKNQW